MWKDILDAISQMSLEINYLDINYAKYKAYRMSKEYQIF